MDTYCHNHWSLEGFGTNSDVKVNWYKIKKEKTRKNKHHLFLRFNRLSVSEGVELPDALCRGVVLESGLCGVDWRLERGVCLGV